MVVARCSPTAMREGSWRVLEEQRIHLRGVALIDMLGPVSSYFVVATSGTLTAQMFSGCVKHRERP